MSPIFRRSAVLAVLTAVVAGAWASEASFQMMPAVSFAAGSLSAYALSGDGQTIVGDFAGGIPFEWTLGSAPIQLSATGPNLQAYVVGLDYHGDVVAGVEYDSSNDRLAVSWQGGLASPFAASAANATLVGVSADGKVFGGWSGATSFIVTNGVAVTVPPPTGYSSLQFVSMSPNGRYFLALGNAANPKYWLLYDSVGRRFVTLGPYNAVQLNAVSNNGTTVGSNDGNAIRFDAGGNESVLPILTGTVTDVATAISADGSVIVGTADETSFIWTAQWGTRSLPAVLTAQGAVLPAQTILNPSSVSRVGLQACVGGTATNGSTLAANAFLSSVRLGPSGFPIDLAGTYLAVKNAVVEVTTDPGGVVGEALPNKQVVEPAPSFVSAPFSDAYRPPTPLSQVNLTGHSYWFDVDLGNPSNWPNPSSTQNYYAGQAASGNVGTELQIRASASTPQGIDVSSYEGLTLSIYRKDNRFWGHVSNLWYDQDVDFPTAVDASKYHVVVSLAASGSVTITFTQMDGQATADGSFPSTTLQLSGGSTENVGLTSASFLVALYNVADPTLGIAAPTSVTVTGFGTDAIPNALYAFSDNPYVSGALGYDGLFYHLNMANLSAKVGGYQASLEHVQPGSSLVSAFFGGEYENTTLFARQTRPAFAPDQTGAFNHAQAVQAPANATTEDLLLETLALGPHYPSTVSAGPFRLKIMPKYKGGGASGLSDANGETLETNVFSSNAVMVDSSPPTLGPLTLMIDGQPASLYRPKAGKLIMVNETVTNGLSGLAGFPAVTATATDTNGNVVATTPIVLGSSDPTKGAFSGSYTTPLGAVDIAFTSSATSRAGLSSTTTSTLAGEFTIPIHLVGTTLTPGTRIWRVLRVVMSGPGFGPIAFNKPVSFFGNGMGRLSITDYEGLPIPASAHFTSLYVKDPYHSLGKASAVTIVNGMYALASGTEIDLPSGDANNDNVIDIEDLAVYATFLSSLEPVTAATTTIVDFTKPLTPAEENPDFDANGLLDAGDYALIVSGNLTLGDPDPALPPPGPAKTTLTYAQATALGMPAWVQQAADVNHDGVLTFAEILAWIKSLQP